MIKCQHCEKEYSSSDDFIKDSFVSSDGLSWDYFHKCLSENEPMVLHGYKKAELIIKKVEE